jgi:mucin-19
MKIIFEKHFFAYYIFILALGSFSSCTKSSSQSSNSGGTTAPTITSTSANTGISPPNISYTYPEYFTVGTSINSLTPANSGSPVPAGNYGSTDTIKGDFNGLSGLAFDQAGNLFAGDDNNDNIKKITPEGVVSTFVVKDSLEYIPGQGFHIYEADPFGLTIDQSGNLCITNTGMNIIKKVTPGGGVSIFAGNFPTANHYINGIGWSAGFFGPMGIAIDQTGNLFVADQGNKVIRKITTDSTVTTFATGFINPTGLAFDPAGNLFVTDGIALNINKVTPAGIVSNFAITGVNEINFRPFGIVFDQSGNLYISDGDGFILRKVNSLGAVIDTFSPIGSSCGLAFDKSGNLYVSQINVILKIITTGYSIMPNLPTGLYFDNATGIISGNPTIASPSTTYTITAHTSTGATSTTSITFSVK